MRFSPLLQRVVRRAVVSDDGVRNRPLRLLVLLGAELVVLLLLYAQELVAKLFVKLFLLVLDKESLLSIELIELGEELVVVRLLESLENLADNVVVLLVVDELNTLVEQLRVLTHGNSAALHSVPRVAHECRGNLLEERRETLSAADVDTLRRELQNRHLGLRDTKVAAHGGEVDVERQLVVPHAVLRVVEVRQLHEHGEPVHDHVLVDGVCPIRVVLIEHVVRRIVLLPVGVVVAFLEEDPSRVDTEGTCHLLVVRKRGRTVLARRLIASRIHRAANNISSCSTLFYHRFLFL